jgi:putative restriction endonuclease
VSAITRPRPEGTRTEQQTECIRLAVARVGQHLFALNVLANCGGRCVFCGLNPGSFGAKRMLVAGHIKPWNDSTSAERLDLRNGLAAYPATTWPSTPACSPGMADARTGEGG